MTHVHTYRRNSSSLTAACINFSMRGLACIPAERDSNGKPDVRCARPLVDGTRDGGIPRILPFRRGIYQLAAHSNDRDSSYRWLVRDSFPSRLFSQSFNWRDAVTRCGIYLPRTISFCLSCLSFLSYARAVYKMCIIVANAEITVSKRSSKTRHCIEKKKKRKSETKKKRNRNRKRYR